MSAQAEGHLDKVGLVFFREAEGWVLTKDKDDWVWGFLGRNGASKGNWKRGQRGWNDKVTRTMLAVSLSRERPTESWL